MLNKVFFGCGKILIIVVFIFLFVLNKTSVLAQEDQVTPLIEPDSSINTDVSYEAKIIRIIEEKQIEVMGVEQVYQKLELKISKGSDKDKIITVENGDLPVANIIHYKVDDRVLVTAQKDPTGKVVYNINDFIRTDSLILLFIIFIVLIVAVAKFNGVTSIFSMGITFGVIFKFILPQILDGQNPIIIAIIGSLIIIPITFYLAHGFNKKTSVAIVSTFTAMIITGILASVFVELSRLTGLSSEEAGFIKQLKQGVLNMKGLLLAGIMIGAVGVLDDITVAQASVVEQLKAASDKLKVWDLYNRSMKIGKDHITSMVNTLVLVYAGASLPLLLLFMDNPHPFSEIVNYEFIAEEVIRTLVGSIGLILAVPITTFLAALTFSQTRNKSKTV